MAYNIIRRENRNDRAVGREANQKKVGEGCYDVTSHAHIRMGERQINLEQVLECIVRGKSIEFQKDKITGDIKVLFQEAADKIPALYVVVAALDTPLIVTVCRTKNEVWECVDNVLRRRERYHE